jgi:hypothetical protein
MFSRSRNERKTFRYRYQNNKPLTSLQSFEKSLFIDVFTQKINQNNLVMVDESDVYNKLESFRIHE